MSILPPTKGARAAEIGDDDLDHLINVFRGSDFTLLDLKSGAIRLRLSRQPAAAPLPGSAGSGSGNSLRVVAPFVGTLTSRVAAGHRVGAGAVLGTIRSLCAETEVVVTEGGTVAAQLVPDGRFVAYGEPLFEMHRETPEGGQSQ
ncbi:hypothetical protein [Maricaulis sp.]|uniref:hypothetical protein n=1 Tax=Maricaulis sp. TaxID=1486257 RepID=UPI002623D121|nr:hypothetical protein [Maricaulis sp.]